MTTARPAALFLAPAWAFTLAPALGRAALRGATRSVRALLRDAARRRRHAADLRLLHGMTEYELRDLGLSHGDLPALSRGAVLGDDWRSWHHLPR